MSKSDWKLMFKKDIKTKLIESKKEFDLYEQTSSVIYLQQAGNKLFSVVENYLMLKYNYRVSNYRQLFDMIKGNSYDENLLLQANQLHRFYYNGELQMETFEAAKLYKIVYEKMQRRIQ